MKPRRVLAPWGISLAVALPLAAWAPPAAAQVSPEEASAIGVDAYLYFHPLVTMDLTRRQLTNVEPGKGGLGGPPNTFVNIPEYPSPDMKVVVRPNFDTLYSSAWLDLTKEPVIVSVPDTDGRYYLLPMLDMWTDVFASPGWRTTGTQAGDFAIVPPGWQPEEAGLPEGVQRIDAPTPQCLDHRAHQDRRSAGLRRRPQDPGGLQDHALVGLGQAFGAGRGRDRPERRHEDSAQSAG
jgi:hypothetical protein